MCIKVCCLSDLHGFLIEDLEPCDVVIICGDIVSLSYQRGWHKAIRWYRNKFKPWVESLPCDKVFFIAGNHDPIEVYTGEMKEEFPIDGKVSYICNEYCEFTKNSQTLKMFGSPFCQVFGHWYFMKDDKTLENYFSKIPENLDILFTHDAPFGVTDVLLQSEYYTGEHIGNKSLATAILKKSPKYVLHGHLHSCSHEFEEFGYSKVINCSILNEDYNQVYKPLFLEI
jgi:Icc-related predicted phosphoesterase